MNTLKKQHGYTLLIVLLTITIMFPLTIMLIDRQLNATRQVHSSEVYHSSIALAEMGIVRGQAEIEQALANLNQEEVHRILVTESSLIAINQAIGELIVSQISELAIQLDEATVLTTVELKNVENDEIRFLIESREAVELDYIITSEVLVETEILRSPDEGGSYDFDNPRDFIGWEDVNQSIINSVDIPDIPNNQPGGVYSGVNQFETAGFDRNISLNPESVFMVNGHMRVSGAFEAQEANTFNVSETFRALGNTTLIGSQNASIGSHARFAGGPFLTHSILKIGGNVNSENTMALNSATLIVEGGLRVATNATVENNSQLTVEGDLSLSNPLRIHNSAADLNGYTALNSFHVTDTEAGMVTIRNLRVGNFELTNGHLATHSLRLGWRTDLRQNSFLTVQGHLFSEGIIAMAPDTSLIVYGNAEFQNSYNSFSFSGTGARVVVYGEGVNMPTHLHQVEYRQVETLAGCSPQRDVNLICFVEDNPPTGGPDSGGGQEPTFAWELKGLQQIEYVGINRFR